MWEEFGGVKERVLGLGKEVGMDLGEGSHEQAVVYENVTGVVMGKWVRNKSGLGGDRGWVRGRSKMNLTAIAPGVNWAHGHWSRNITGKEGAMMLRVEENDDVKKELVYDLGDQNGLLLPGEKGLVREVMATLTVEDETHSGDGWEIRVHGLHWPRKGELVMTTSSEKFAGVFGLPHLMPTKDQYRSSQQLLNRTLGAALWKRENTIWGDVSDPWSTDDMMPSPHCEYVVYAQVHPVKREDLHKIFDPKVPENVLREIRDVERELRNPTGAPIVKPPPITMSTVIFSPDCGFILESKGPPSYTPIEGKHLKGLKQEVFVINVKHWSLIWAIALTVQVLLIRIQMKESSTPSTVSRISLYTVTMMALADAILFGCLMLLACQAPAVFPTATIAAFAVSMSVGLGVRFVTDVWNVQEPERREVQRVRDAQLAAQLAEFQARRDDFYARHPELLPPAQRPAVVLTAAGADIAQTNAAPANQMPGTLNPEPPATEISMNPSGPVPRTTDSAASPDIPIIIPSDQDIDAEIAENAAATAPTPPPLSVPASANPGLPQPTVAMLRQAEMTTSYGQYLMLFICFFFITVNSASWPALIRRIYINTLGVIYLSLWIPQIYRNVIRNCRKSFMWKFVIGQSVLRVVPFAYFYLKEDNVLFADTSPFSVTLLVGWLWLQIWVLILQNILGPRFALPKGWLPDAWNYHPVLRDDDVEGGGMPIGLVKAPGSPKLDRVRTGEGAHKDSQNHTRSVDCAICMQKLEVPVIPVGGDTSSAAATGVGSVTSMLARRLYMVTPCRHVFHSNCLEGWMRYRLQCPICRENLPPL
jgi:hypothetical protein